MGFTKRGLIRTGLASFLPVPAVISYSGNAGESEDDLKGEKEYLEEFAELIDPNSGVVQELSQDAEISQTKSIFSVNYPDKVEFEPVSDENLYGEKDRLVSPEEYVQKDFRGDCDAYSVFNTSLLISKGLNSRMIVSLDDNHAWTEVKAGENYFITDVNKPGVFYRRDPEGYKEIDPEYMIDDKDIDSFNSGW